MSRRSEYIDLWVGQRIGVLRRERGLSQSAMAGRLGISFQQVQKYESGSNRVSAARLYQLAGVLACPVSAFFPPEDTPPPLLPLDAEWRRLLDAFPRISDADLRRSVIDVVQALALRG